MKTTRPVGPPAVSPHGRMVVAGWVPAGESVRPPRHDVDRQLESNWPGYRVTSGMIPPGIIPHCHGWNRSATRQTVKGPTPNGVGPAASEDQRSSNAPLFTPSLKATHSTRLYTWIGASGPALLSAIATSPDPSSAFAR